MQILKKILKILAFPFLLLGSFIAYLVGGALKFIGFAIYIALFISWVLGQILFIATAFAMSQDRAIAVMPTDPLLAKITLISGWLVVLLSFIPALIVNGFIHKAFNILSSESFMGLGEKGFLFYLFWLIWFAIWLVAAFFSFAAMREIG